MSIEALIKENNELLRESIEQMKLINAGRELALEKITANDASTASKRTRKKADESAAAADEGHTAGAAASKSAEESPAASKSSAPDAPEPNWNPDISDAGLRSLAQALVGKVKPDESNKTKISGHLSSVLQELGTPKLVGPDSTLDDNGRRRAAFYLTRFVNDVPVDFAADYDFNEDPLRQAVEPEADADGGDFADIG